MANIHEEFIKSSIEMFKENHPCETCGEGSLIEVEMKTGASIFFCDEHSPYQDENEVWGHHSIDMQDVAFVMGWHPAMGVW